MTLDEYHSKFEVLNKKAIEADLEVNMLQERFLEELPFERGDGVLLDGKYVGEVLDKFINVMDEPTVVVERPPIDEDDNEKKQSRYFIGADLEKLVKTKPKEYDFINRRSVKWRKYPENKPCYSGDFWIVIKDLQDGVRQERCPFNVENGKFKYYTDQSRILYWAEQPELPDELLNHAGTSV